MAGQRLSHLDGLRGAAAFSVFVCHFVQTFLPHIYYLDRSESHGLWEDEFATSPFNIVVNGNFAVCLFFVLSGYVLSCRYLAGGDLESLRRLAVKRYLRLMLPTLGAVLLAWAILWAGGYSFGAAQPFTKSGMRDTYATLVPLWTALEQGAVGAFFFGQWSLDPVLWTMQTELCGSFVVFALLALFAGMRCRWAAWAVAALIFYDGYYLAFVLGVMLAELDARGDGGEAPYPLVLALVTLGIYCGSYPYYGAETGLWSALPAIGSAHKPVFYHVLGAFALILATRLFAEAREVFSKRPFRFLGRISYSLYLVHFPLVCSVATGLFLVLLPHFGYAAAVAAVFVAMVPVVLAASTLFTLLVDEPAIRLSDRFARLVMGSPTPPG